MAAFEIKQNDLLPVFRVEVTGAGDLSDATLRFHMRKRKGAVVVDAAATVESYNETTDTNVFRYDWIAGDTATTGSYQAEFEATTREAAHDADQRVLRHRDLRGNRMTSDDPRSHATPASGDDRGPHDPT
jgi:hypothetical protein